jgi:hypothetical protein
MGGGLQPMLTPQMASAAQNLAAMGSGRDSMLAHINPREAQILMQLGGKGNTNPRTGLPQFDDGGGGGDGSGGQTQTTSSAPGTFVDQPTPSGFAPSNIGYQGGVPDPSISPFDSALVSSYGASPSNAAPIDPAMFNYVNDYYATLGTPQGGTPTNPFLIASDPGAPDNAAQFLATPGNPDFTINPSGYADFSQQGLSAFDTYTAQQVATDEANAKKNSSGLGAIFPDIIGGLVGAAGLAVGGEALLGGLGDAAISSGDVTGAVEGVTSGDVTGAGLGAGADFGDAAITSGDVTGAIADPAATASTLGTDASVFSGDVTGAVEPVVSGDVTGAIPGSVSDTLTSLGGSPTLAQLAAATPDSLVGDASSVPAATDAAIYSGDVTGSVDAGGDAFAGNTLGVGGSAAGGDTLDPFAGNTIDAAPGSASAVPGGGSGGSGIGNWFSNVGTKLETGLTNDLTDPFKLLGLGAAGLGAISSLGGQNKNIGNIGSNENALNALATQTGQTGTQLQSYLTSGTLPPGLMQQVNQATAAAIQNIKAKYAANGMGPNSTPEQQDISKIQQNVPATIATIGQQLLTAGTADLQITSGVLQNLLTQNTSLNNQTNAAIANLARALSGTSTTPQNTNTSGTSPASTPVVDSNTSTFT